MQQIAIGKLTENGVIMNASPILFEEKDAMFMGLLKRTHRNDKITALIDLTKRLKKIDNIKNKKTGYKAFNEKDRILNDIISILSEVDKTTNSHMFKYSDDMDLIRAQYSLIELAFHCLMFAENVRYDFKRDYYEIVSQIMMRNELSLANVALGEDLE